MKTNDTVIRFTGIGGQGILFAGKMLAEAALSAGIHPCFAPSYGAEKRDRKSTRLNSSHVRISYAVFCLKKKKNKTKSKHPRIKERLRVYSPRSTAGVAS